MRRPFAIDRERTHATQERGMTTAEYALGTVAAVTGVGVLVALLAELTAPTRILWPLIRALIDAVLHLFGGR